VPEQRFVRSDEVLWRHGGGVLVLARIDGYSVTVTGSGDAVWEALEKPRTLTCMSDLLAEVFGADQSVVRADLEPLLTQLVEEGFVRTVG